MIKSVIKRDGRVVLFDEGKIASAVLKALEAAGEGDAREAARVANKVSRHLEVDCGEESPSIEQIQDEVETGLMVFAACLPIAIVGMISAYHQGKTAVAAIGIVAKKPDQFGKAMLFPAMVETYAILALLISILAVTSIRV